MTSVAEAIANSGELENWIADKLSDLTFQNDDRSRVAGALVQIGLTHHSSIVFLLRNKRHASAFALLRSQIDALARGNYYLRLATDDQLAAFVNGNDPPSTPKIIEQLEQGGHFDKGEMSTFLSQLWSLFCDFTHGGGRIVVAHLTADTIEPAYSDDQIKQLLDLSNGFAMILGTTLADLAGNEVLGLKIVDRLKEMNFG